MPKGKKSSWRRAFAAAKQVPGRRVNWRREALMAQDAYVAEAKAGDVLRRKVAELDTLLRKAQAHSLRCEADLIEARAVNARQKKTAEEIDHQIDAQRLRAAAASAACEIDRAIALGEQGQF